MLDVNSLNELVQREISSRVDQAIQDILDREDWFQTLEQRIVAEVQQRVIGRFQNVAHIPGLTEIITDSIGQMFDHGRIPSIDNFVDTDKIRQGLDSAVQQLVTDSIDNLVLDAEWLAKIQTLVDANMTSRVTEHMQMIDFRHTIADSVNGNMEQWRERLAADVRRPGLHDTAQQLELTVMDGAVVAEHCLVSRDLTVTNTAAIHGSLIVQDLAVMGTVNVDNHSWQGVADRASDLALAKLTPGWRENLVQQVLDLARTQGIDFNAVTINGNPIIDSGRLNPEVIHSNLQTVGVLENLTATGTVKLGNTITVLPRRLGINTMEPEMALSIWDEEVSLVAGKLENDKIKSVISLSASLLKKKSNPTIISRRSVSSTGLYLASPAAFILN